MLDSIIKKIEEQTGNTPKHIKDEIRSISEERNVITEIGGLLLCKKYNIDINDMLEQVRNTLFKENET
jgi:hypothetical protein